MKQDSEQVREARKIIKEALFGHAKYADTEINPDCWSFASSKKGISLRLVQQLCSIATSKDQIISRLMKDIYYRDLDKVWMELFLLNVMKNNPNNSWKQFMKAEDVYRLKHAVINVLLLRMLSENRILIKAGRDNIPLKVMKRGSVLIIDVMENGLLELRYKMKKNLDEIPPELYFSGIVNIHIPYGRLHSTIKRRLRERKLLT